MLLPGRPVSAQPCCCFRCLQRSPTLHPAGPPCSAKASPAHPAAAAAAIALGAAGSSDSPRALDGGTSPPAPSPASMFPRSHPIVRKSLTVSQTLLKKF